MKKSDKTKIYERALIDSKEMQNKRDLGISEVANSTMQMAYRFYGLVNGSDKK